MHGRRVEMAFDETGANQNLAARLNEWQSAGDERLWKLIISVRPNGADRWWVKVPPR